MSDILDMLLVNKQIEEMQEFIRKISLQTPDKPDYFSSCKQCKHNIEEAKGFLDTDQQEDI